MIEANEQPDLKRIQIKGGVLSPAELKQIADLAEALGQGTLHFGSRQDILLPEGVAIDPQVLRKFPSILVDTIHERFTHNIVSSYVAADLFAGYSWLSGATYLYILEQFQERPTLEVNITDPNQRLVPLFSGQLNFIASEQEDYWYLFLRLPGWQGVNRYPVLIYSWDIGKVTKTIESCYKESTNVNDLFEEVSNEIDANCRNIKKGLHIPFEPFPYYEGMNKQGRNQYWLGLYWRNNQYDTTFLKAVCDLCMECKIGKVCLTPWKSLIIKGIPANEKLKWEKLLGRFGINVRHSSVELNWHLPVSDSEALNLKKYLVQKFDQKDISTYGLTFGLKRSYGVNFTSIVIEENVKSSTLKRLSTKPSYNLLYAEQFNPNTLRYVTYAQDISKTELPMLLMELSQLYFDQLGESDEITTKEISEKPNESLAISLNAYECQNCKSIYDRTYGDSLAGIEKGIPFEQLEDTYTCSICNAGKESFVKK